MSDRNDSARLSPDERLRDAAARSRSAWTDCSGYADRQPFGWQEARALPVRASPQYPNHAPPQISSLERRPIATYVISRVKRAVGGTLVAHQAGE